MDPNASASINKGDIAEAKLAADADTSNKMAAEVSAILKRAQERLDSTIRTLMAADGKASKKQIGTALQRILDLLEAANMSDTVIRNYLYTNTLNVNLRLRALRRVLDGRLDSPLTEEELKAAMDALIKEDAAVIEKKKSDDLSASLRDAQLAAAKEDS